MAARCFYLCQALSEHSYISYHYHIFGLQNNAGLLSLEVSKCIPEDGGKYSCRARNDEGGDETSCDILVEGTYTTIEVVRVMLYLFTFLLLFLLLFLFTSYSKNKHRSNSNYLFNPSRLLSSKKHGCKEFRKPYKPSHVGIHWIALAE